MLESSAIDVRRRGRFLLWPWLVLLLTTLPAIWHVVHYEDDIDVEFPNVARPTFSKMPSPSYRLAEPGDTIDRVGIYFSAAGLVFCLIGGLSSRGKGLWPAATAVLLFGFWEAANPGPSLDGWHGLGWRAIFNSDAPMGLRIGLALAAATLAAIVALNFRSVRGRLSEFYSDSRADGSLWLWGVAILLMIARYADIPGIEPQGYWPRWALVWGLLAIDLNLLRAFPRIKLRRGLVLTPAILGCWLMIVLGGVWLSWYHRPLARLRPVVSDRIYMSAMPTRRGLEVAYQRHPFKTIINLFPEDLLGQSPYYKEEREFAEKHGINYVLSPPDTSLEASSAFLDETLRLAQDPSAWPILVHCHACMDRTPAWMGIYRFLIQQQPLLGIMQEIEQHRGYRPKSSVTLLYNRVLADRAPERYAADPTAAVLRECAKGSIDPASSRLSTMVRQAEANPAQHRGVSKGPGSPADSRSEGELRR